MMSNDEEIPEAIDIVSLGKLTEFETVDWVFPSITNCPIKSCNISFRHRNLAINHFVQQHADSTMKCMYCDELFPANDAQILFEHNRVQHLNESSQRLKAICRNCLPVMSITDKDNDQSEFEQQVNNGCANDDTNYNVKLGESTDFEEITWLFPDTNQCPMEHCALPFSHRSVAALHFRMKHAKTTMPCTLCDELILAINAQDLLQHYENMHPNEPHPELKMQSPIPMLEEDLPQSNLYCWICAKDDTNLRCAKCKRRFHQECVENHVGSDQMCIECTKEGDFKDFNVRFIPQILGFIKADEKFAPLIPIRFDIDQTINLIDIWGMERKCYDSVSQFENDLKWFEHNCRSIFPQENKIQAALKGINDYVTEHIKFIQACGGCYQNAYEHCGGSSVKQCKKLHLLVWAKVTGYVHWPAKVLAVNAENGQVIVQFFGDYTWCILPVRNCFLFSKQNPERKRGPPTKQLRRAMADVDEYIEHIRSRYGAFNYETQQTIFDPEKIDEYLERMIGDRQNSADGASESDSEYVQPNLPVNSRKRKVQTVTFNGSSAKRNRNEKDFGTIFKSMKISLAQGLRGLNQINVNNAQKIGKLRRDLAKITRENEALVQQNDALIVDKMTLEETHRVQVKRFDDEKKDLEQKLADAEEAKRETKQSFDDAKKELLEKIAALEGNKNKNTCAHCRNYVDSLVFCNNDCGVKHYTNSQ